MTPFVFRAPATGGPGKPLPLALAGLPDELLGRRCHYLRKELAKVGEYVHRGTGKAFAITRDRMDGWIRAFKKRAGKGIKAPLTKQHTLNPKADDAVGYVVALSRQGDSLYADLQFIGDDALALAARNDVSLCAVTDVLDGDGDKHAEAIDHIALTPIPALTNLGGYVKIAASASPFADNPVYEFSAGQARQGAPMPFAFEPELGRKLRDKLALGADVPDEQVAVVAAEHVSAAIDVQKQAKADAASVTALSADVKRLQKELADANGKVLALSADAPKELDGRTVALMKRQFKLDRQAVIDSGVISTAGMDKIDALLGANDNNGIALSLSAGDGEEADMIYSRLCEIIAAHPGIKTSGAINRSKLALSANAGNPDGPVSDERYRELMALSPAGQEVLNSSRK